MFRLRRLLVELLLVTALEPRTHHHHHHQQQCVDTKSQIEEHSREKHLFRGQKKNGRLIGIVKIIPSSLRLRKMTTRPSLFRQILPQVEKGKLKSTQVEGQRLRRNDSQLNEPSRVLNEEEKIIICVGKGEGGERQK